jgi:hypothetical protein
MKKLMIIIAVIAMVGAFTATSMAAEWNFYGHSRMTTVYYDRSKDVIGSDFDDQDLTWTSQTNARIGSKVKASDAVSGRFEVGMSSNNGNKGFIDPAVPEDKYKNDKDTVWLRLMYGEYNFGSGSLLVGQNYTPVDQILSANIGVLPSVILAAKTDPIYDGEGNSLQIGSFYESRLPQIALKFGGLTLAFIQPKTTTSGIYTDADTTIPKVEVSYKFKSDMFSIEPYAGYNTVDMTDPATDNSVSVDSYVIGAAANVNFGPMFAKGQFFFSQNPQNFGRSNVGLYDGAVLNGTDTEDADCWGGQLIAGFKMSDMFTFEAGYSYDHNEIDVAGVTGENDPSHWYVNATITLAPGVFIIPEVGMFDFGDNEQGGTSVDRGDATYFGAKWQINF